MSNRGSIRLRELVDKLTRLEIKCHRCERHRRVSLARFGPRARERAIMFGETVLRRT